MAGEHQVIIAGAGTMGAGIAQVAATHSWQVHLLDVDEATVRAAIDQIAKRLDRLVEKGRLAAHERNASAERLHVAQREAPVPAELLIEAVAEDLKVKTSVIKGLLPRLAGDTIIATNTSSLSVSRLGESIGEPERTVGMHFFNPAPLLKLVEIIAGQRTRPDVIDRAAAIARSWEKTVARAADVPGFIVNHVARPFYLEAFRILEDGYAGPEEIDAAMKDLGGFRMGPLELTDLIGQHVNAATTRSVWEQLDRPALLAPSRLQEQLVARGALGRKSGEGVYRYQDDGQQRSALAIERHKFDPSGELRERVRDFTAHAGDTSGDDRQQYIFARILVAIIAQAALAHERGVAEREDIDTALRYGANYPRGPFDWAERIGFDRCSRLLEALNATVDDDRFSAPRLLHAHA